MEEWGPAVEGGLRAREEWLPHKQLGSAARSVGPLGLILCAPLGPRESPGGLRRSFKYCRYQGVTEAVEKSAEEAAEASAGVEGDGILCVFDRRVLIFCKVKRVVCGKS